MSIYTIVLAGGRGSRLPIEWPINKQFAKKPNGLTFIQDVVRMITYGSAVKASLVHPIVTNDVQASYAIEQLSKYQVPTTNAVQFDPLLGYVAVMAYAEDYIRSIDPSAVTLITPSDWHIVGQDKLTEAILDSCSYAESGTPILVGAKVADANIVGSCGNAMYDPLSSGPIYDIEDFIEKPLKIGGPSLVQQILRDDNTVVNTGIYAVRADQFCEAYPIEYIEELLREFKASRSTDTDLGLDPTEMVRKLGMKLYIGGFEWRDLGTLDAYYKSAVHTPNHKNASIGEVYRHECRNGLFISSTEGVVLDVSYAKENDVILASIGDDGILNLAWTTREMSQKAGIITDFFESGNPLLLCESEDCRVLPSNLSGHVHAVFLGKKHAYFDPYRQNDGKIIVRATCA